MIEGQKVFFSYSRDDGEAIATRLADELRSAGINVWLDQHDIRPGKAWDIEIEKALETSTCVLFIATPQSTTSTNVLNEVYYALEENKEVLPIIFSDCKIPFRLKRLQHIDFSEDYDLGLDRLIKTLTQVVRQNNEEKAQHNGAPPAIRTGKFSSANKIIGISISVIIAVALYFFVVNKSNPVTENLKTVASDSTPNESDSTIIANETVNTGAAKSSTKIKPTGTAKASLADTGYYRLMLQNGETFLDAVHCTNQVALGNVSDFADGACQLWRLVPTGTGWFGLQLKNGGQFLAADNCSASVVLIPSNQFDENDGCHLWRLQPAGKGWSRLQLRFEEQFLDAVQCGNKVALNAGSTYADGACQKWKLIKL
jgi:hypothetical protein